VPLVPSVSTGRPASSAACPSSTTATTSSSSQPVVNLLRKSVVSSALVYDRFAPGYPCVVPAYLTGTDTSAFWSSPQSVLELAPTQAGMHSAGTVMFSAAAASDQTLTVEGAASSTYLSGDGLEAYLFVSPLSASNWSAPYYATSPGGANGTFVSPQGAVIFPYSSNPYVAVQWDPAYGAWNSVFLYLVSPAAGGSVLPSDIQTFQLSSSSTNAPFAYDFISLKVGYDVSSNSVTVTVTDASSSLLLVQANETLGSIAPSYHPGFSSGTYYYFGAGGSANGQNSWGLLYLSLGTSSSSSSFPVIYLVLLGLGGVAAAGVVLVVWLNRKK